MAGKGAESHGNNQGTNTDMKRSGRFLEWLLYIFVIATFLALYFTVVF